MAYTKVLTEEFDLSGNIVKPSTKSVVFGKLAPESEGDIKIVRLHLPNALKLTKVKIGIVGASVQGFGVNSIFKYAVSSSVNPNIVLSNFFSGINATNTLNNASNIEVGVSSSSKKKSNYVYLSAICPPRYIGSGECVYRWFFEYED